MCEIPSDDYLSLDESDYEDDDQMNVKTNLIGTFKDAFTRNIKDENDEKKGKKHIDKDFLTSENDEEEDEIEKKRKKKKKNKKSKHRHQKEKKS